MSIRLAMLMLMLLGLADCAAARPRVEVNFSDPKMTAQTLFRGAIENDPAAVEAAFVTQGHYRKIVHDIALTLTSMAHLEQAIQRRLGVKAGTKIFQEGFDGEIYSVAGDTPMREALQKLDKFAIEFHGDAAILMGPDRNTTEEVTAWLEITIRFKKIADQWKIDLRPSGLPKKDNWTELSIPDQNPSDAGWMSVLARVAGDINKLANDIDHGKYKTAEEIATALSEINEKAERKGG